MRKLERIVNYVSTFAILAVSFCFNELLLVVGLRQFEKKAVSGVSRLH